MTRLMLSACNHAHTACLDWQHVLMCRKCFATFIRWLLLSCCPVQANLSGALDTITDAVKELVSAQHAVVLLMDAARQVLWTSITNAGTGGWQGYSGFSRGKASSALVGQASSKWF